MRADELWLVRHGETTASAVHRIAGWADPPLTAVGRQQARSAGRRLAGTVFDGVWTSDLRRATDSARLMAEAAGGDWPRAVADPRLRELDFGVFEGAHYDDRRAAFAEVVQRFREFEVPGGESWRQLRRRVDDFVAGLPRGRHLLVVHGGVIRILTQDRGVDRFVATGSVVVVDRTSGRVEVDAPE